MEIQIPWQGWFSLALAAVTLLMLIFSHVRVHLVMASAVAILSVLGILPATEVLSGFGNPGLIAVAAMFVIAAGLQGAGSIDLLIKRVLGQPKSVRSALGRMFFPVLLLSAFLNNTPIVATMIPAIHVWCRKINISPAKLMIPLSYTAILGGTLTLIGTSTNLLVNAQYQILTGEEGLGLFSITALGLPVALVGLLFMWLFFPSWLPERSEKQAFGNLREFTLEVRVLQKGPLVGRTVQEAGLRDLERVYLAEIERQGSIITAVPSEERLHGDDRLIFAGDTQAISDLLRIHGLVASEEARALPESSSENPLESSLENLSESSFESSAENSFENSFENVPEDSRAERQLIEAVVSPHCATLGLAIRDARFRARYGAVVLAVARRGERVKGNLGTIKLEAGDTLLLKARPNFVSRQRYSKEFLLINDLDVETPRHERAYLAWGILFSVVLLAAFQVLSLLNATLVGALAMVFSGCCSVNQAEKSLDLGLFITIACSFALGAALQKTGVASLLATLIVQLSFGQPALMLVLTYIAVSILTLIITNNAAAVLMLPISLELAQNAGLSSQPFVLALMMGASASFATPLSYQTNLMVYGPGSYRFSDFLRVGLPLNLILGAVTLLVLLWGWSF